MAIALDFETYVTDIGLVATDIIIRATSTITLEDALAYVRGRVDEMGLSPAYAGIDVKSSLTDARNGNIYEVFSSTWMEKYEQTEYYNVVLDKEALDTLDPRITALENALGITDTTVTSLPDNVLTGTANQVSVAAVDGVLEVIVDNPDLLTFEVFINHNESVAIDDHTIITSPTTFEIRLYDFSTFDRIPLNCAANPVEVSYVVIFR